MPAVRRIGKVEDAPGCKLSNLGGSVSAINEYGVRGADVGRSTPG
jgi:hypothetical protein